jgi:hypothetical protein
MKEYLGDSVYAEFDGFMVKLTTENGLGPGNVIFLEPEVLQALNIYYARMTRHNVAEDATEPAN